MTLQLTLQQAADITGCSVPKRWADAPMGPISTDSRSIKPGMTFLALRGEHHDGHKYVAKAVDLGAAALIVASEFKPPAISAEIPILRVPAFRLGNSEAKRSSFHFLPSSR